MSEQIPEGKFTGMSMKVGEEIKNFVPVEKYELLRARCERYEKVLKQIKDWCHGDAVVYSAIALGDALAETEGKERRKSMPKGKPQFCATAKEKRKKMNQDLKGLCTNPKRRIEDIAWNLNPKVFKAKKRYE